MSSKNTPGGRRKPRREVNMEATRAALIKIARKHFARHGYSRAEIGRIAVQSLRSLIAEAGPGVDHEVKTHLVIRQTTGPVQ